MDDSVIHDLSDAQMAVLAGGRFSFNLQVAPVVAVNTAVVPALQANAGASVGLGVLGGSGSSLLAQITSLNLVSVI